MKCYININPNAAIQHRGTRVGVQTVELALDKLSAAQLDVLNQIAGGKKPYADGINLGDLGIGVATAEAIVEDLDKRIAANAENERRKAAALERKIAELREALSTRKLSERFTHYPSLGDEGHLTEATPSAPDIYADEKPLIPAELLRELEAWKAECEAANAAANAELNKKLAAKAAADEAAKKAREAEQAAWIQAHGSRRLKTMLAEGIKHNAVYLDERLALERPGWQYQSDVGGTFDEPRNIPETAVDLLEEARKIDPDAKLAYWIEDEDDGLEHEKPSRRYVAVSTFLGASTVFTG